MGKHKLFKRKNSRFWQVWINGERHSTKCTDRRAAELKADDLERRAADPTHRAASETTLAEALRLWIADRRVAGRSERTLDYYRAKAGVLVRLFGEGATLARLTREAVRAFVAARRDELVVEADKAKGRDERKVTEHTVSKELGVLRSCLRWARAEGLWSGDPAAVLPAGHSKRYEPRRAYLTEEQAWALVRALERPRPEGEPQPASAPGRAAHAALLVGLAVRWGESLRAERGDVDLAKGVVRVRGTKTKKAARVVPVLAPARAFVEYALERAPGGEGRPLFRPWPNHLRDLARACERAGVPRACALDLRRSLPTWCRQAGVPLELVAEVLGHASLRMVYEVYGVPEPVATGAAIDRYLAAAKAPPAPPAEPERAAG